MGRLSDRRLKENEIIFRQANQQVQEFVEDLTKQPSRVLAFYCECSQADCRKRINLSIKDYRRLHRSDRQFVVLPGHQTPKVEKTVQETEDFAVVEKQGKMPSSKSLDLALSRLSAEDT